MYIFANQSEYTNCMDGAKFLGVRQKWSVVKRLWNDKQGFHPSVNFQFKLSGQSNKLRMSVDLESATFPQNKLAVEVYKVNKHYGKLPILRDICMHVQEGIV